MAESVAAALIIFAGLPGTGKSTLARALALERGAVHVRIDTIESALRAALPKEYPIDDLGYRVAYAIAEDNLRLGLTVVADSVNPLGLTRDAWRNVAARAGVRAMDVEIICSDGEEHRRRVETRVADIAGLELPAWSDVVAREYEPWASERTVIDTAGRSVAQSLRELCRAVATGGVTG